jgi:hypothetical protein
VCKAVQVVIELVETADKDWLAAVRLIESVDKFFIAPVCPSFPSAVWNCINDW